jgi:hypothetical protein
MSRRKVGAMSTETMILLGVVAVAGIYFLTRTTSQPVNPYGSTLVTGPGGQMLLPGNTAAQDISAGSQGASNIINSLSNAGIFG